MSKTIKISDKAYSDLKVINKLTGIPMTKISDDVYGRQRASVELITSRCSCSAKNKMPHGNHSTGCKNKVTV